jgi:hypothetical protein
MLTTKVKGTCVALLAHLLPMASTAVAASMASAASVANSPKSTPWVEVVSSDPTPVIDKATAAKYGTPRSIYSFVEWACMHPWAYAHARRTHSHTSSYARRPFAVIMHTAYTVFTLLVGWASCTRRMRVCMPFAVTMHTAHLFVCLFNLLVGWASHIA